MPITADLVRELAARGERTTLDFKATDYDWLQKSSNAELAKDLMAIANVLSVGDSPGYILIGVENDGTIVGIKRHLDDADLHTKLRGLLNHTPRFVYTPVDVDGLSVGVYEITPGGRPFFPLKEAGKLRRNVAVYRDGTSTDDASPTQIIEWHRRDDPDSHRRNALELQKLDAEAEVHGELTAEIVGIGAEGINFILHIRNTSHRAFDATHLRWFVEWNERMNAALDLPILDGYVPPFGEHPISDGGRITPGDIVRFRFTFNRGMALAHYKDTGLSVRGFNGNFAHYRFEVEARGELGRTKVLSTRVETIA